ncbi:hypothetical protein JKG47_12660 [Acidithiobacillus sp. MC6.1]|nr:hypothetical protein [Acidithiobacillus sp. MC6.1]
MKNVIIDDEDALACRALLAGVLMQAIANAEKQDESARRWLRGPVAAGRMLLLDILPEVVVPRLEAKWAAVDEKRRKRRMCAA